MPRTTWIPLACSAAFLVACTTHTPFAKQALDEPMKPVVSDSEVIRSADVDKPDVPELQSLEERAKTKTPSVEVDSMALDVESVAMEVGSTESDSKKPATSDMGSTESSSTGLVVIGGELGDEAEAGTPGDPPEEKRQAALGNVVTDAAWVSSEIVELPSFEPIYFDTDSAKLDPSAVQSLVELLVEKPELAVRLKGHSDPRGSDAHNLALATRRAEAVQRTLLQGGVHPNQLSVESFGSSQLVSDEATEDGWKKNRRVDIQFTAKQDATPKP
ncbi:OmpA family protein [Myxococcota bacterium]|nr:OmpA family protein [Myxococcota bacterium]